MAKRKRKGEKVRVDFRPNRQQPGREADWTRQYHNKSDELQDTRLSESVRAKGDLSRKRTIITDDDQPAIDQALWVSGAVVAVHGLVCRVAAEQRAIWNCTVRRVLRTLSIDTRSPVVTGDRVWFSPLTPADADERVGVIERVEERRSVLTRRDRRGRAHAIVANADQLLIVASLAQPRLKPHLIDRYLIAAEKGDLRPVICLNKCDLHETQLDLEDEGLAPDLLSPEEIAAEYERLGYRCIFASAVTGLGIDALRTEMGGHINVLSGQSGVGKSSLINAVQPGLDLVIGAVSEENEKGRHTTSHAQLLPLDSGGFVVDTPGIRQFDLWNVDPGELEALFVEIAPLVPHCRYNDCTHIDQAGCAVEAAVEDGRISERRYLSYCKMYGEMLGSG